MHIEIDSKHEHSIWYKAVSDAGSVIIKELPIYFGKIQFPRFDFDYLVITADLQGRELDETKNRLLGEVVPIEIISLLEDKDAKRIITFLAGDFYVRENLDKKGGIGDVLNVWESFSSISDHVVGVAGNHDRFKDLVDMKKVLEFFSKEKENSSYLSGKTITVNSSIIGGLDGIIGNNKRPFRRSKEEFIKEFKNIIEVNPDILIMHDGPEGPDGKGEGLEELNQLVLKSQVKLIIRGHKHWDEFFLRYSNGTYIINAHEKVIILKNENK